MHSKNNNGDFNIIDIIFEVKTNQDIQNVQHTIIEEYTQYL